MRRFEFTRNRSSALAFALAALLGAALADPAVRSAVTRPLTASGTVVLPDHTLRGWDPVTVFFSEDRGPAAPGPEDHPERHARLEPEWPGAWRWLDGRTLQFQPAEPWPPLGAFRVRAGGGAVDLATLSDPPLSVDPGADREGLDPVETITLTFRAPIETEVLERMLSVETRPLPGLDAAAARWRGAADFAIKRLYTEPATVEGLADLGYQQDGAEPGYVYAVVLNEPIPTDTRATVHLRLSRDEGRDEGARWASAFSTAADLRLSAVGCPDQQLPVPPEGARFSSDAPLACAQRGLVLDFSTAPAAVMDSVARNLVQITPSISDLAFSLQDRRLTITGAFRPDQAYQITVTPTGLSDQRGRPIAASGPTRYAVRFAAARRYARWVDGQGLLERYGPKTVPIEVAGQEPLDLRLFAIDPLDAAFWPLSNGPLVLSDAARPPAPGTEPEQPGEDAGEYRSDNERARLLQLLGSPPVSTVIPSPSASPELARVGLDLGPWMEKVVGRDQPGTWLVGVRTASGGPERQYMRVQVTDLALTAVEERDAVRFVVSSLSSGAPVPGAKIRVQGQIPADDGQRWGDLASLSTGADGSATWKAPGPGEGGRYPQRVVVQKGADTLVLSPQDPPPTYQQNHWGDQGGGWLAWAWEDLEGRAEPEKTLCHLWTERPVYRPEEEVHLRAWVRTQLAGSLSAASGRYTLVINGPPGSSWRFPLELDVHGGLYQRFEDPARPSGAYTARLEQDGGGTVCSASFLTESYRIPTFEVALQEPAQASTDRPFQVALNASYYAGGALAGRPVRWRVTRFPATWQPPARAGYVFASDARFSGGTGGETEARLEQEARTDANGGASLSLDPTREADARPRTYVVEATVTAEDASTVTNTVRVDALPAFVLGAKLPRYVDAGSAIPLSLLAVNPKGEPVAGLPVHVALSRREWHSVLADSDITSSAPRYRTDTVDVPVKALDLKTGAAPLEQLLQVDRAGVYVVELSARDALGRAQRLSVDLYVAGPEDQAWGKAQAGVFTLAPDRVAYDPGQTANIVLQSPFRTARALAVIEAPEGNRYQWLNVSGGSATLRVAVERTWTPKIPIHVLLMRGRDGDPASADSRIDLGKPATVASTQWITVNPTERQVVVKVESPARALPGEIVPITVRLASPAGRPLSGEVALWLVDQAVLALGREARLDPVPSFLSALRSTLLFRDTRNLAYGRIPFAAAPGGDGGEEGGVLERVAVRKDMKPVPYYEPSLAVGASGSATVKVKLPDNLTVFKIRAKAACGEERFGAGTGEIAVRQPVVVQPALPRFVRPGDRFVATAVGRVVEGPAGPGAAEIDADGVEVLGPERLTLALETGSPALARFQVQVPTPTLDAKGQLTRDHATLKLGVRRDADGVGDAFETSLPIRDDREEVLNRQALSLKPGERVAIAAVPAARPGSLRRSWVASDVPGVMEAAGAAAALLRWPHGDTPALIARARGWLALGSLRAALLPNEPVAGLDAALRETVETLAARVDARGLVPAFPGSPGRVWLTASALELVVDARAAGLQVPPTLSLRLEEGLQRALRSDAGVFLSGEDQVERAFALVALARAGKLDAGYYAELARTARVSDLEGVAAIVRAGAAGSAADRGRARGLLPMLTGAVIARLDAGREVYDHLAGGRGRDPRIQASEARTLASMVRALQAIGSEDPKLELLRQALLRVGGPDGWGSPDADAAALLALADRLSAPPKSAWKVDIQDGDGSPTLSPVGASVASVVTTSGGAASATASGAPLGLWVETRYRPAEDGASATATSAGFVVERVIERVGPRGEPGERISLAAAKHALALKVGDVVEEHLTVVTPKDRGFVAVTVPLAAGMELLNPRLATAPPEATPRERASRTPAWEDWRDDAVIFYFESLPASTLTLSFRARATTEGSFVQPPARAEALQDRAVRGSSDGVRVEIAAP